MEGGGDGRWVRRCKRNGKEANLRIWGWKEQTDGRRRYRKDDGEMEPWGEKIERNVLLKVFIEELMPSCIWLTIQQNSMHMYKSMNIRLWVQARTDKEKESELEWRADPGENQRDVVWNGLSNPSVQIPASMESKAGTTGGEEWPGTFV